MIAVVIEEVEVAVAAVGGGAENGAVVVAVVVEAMAEVVAGAKFVAAIVDEVPGFAFADVKSILVFYSCTPFVIVAVSAFELGADVEDPLPTGSETAAYAWAW